jgi:hypothetical protein
MEIKSLQKLLIDKATYSQVIQDCITETANWITEYIAKPHPSLPNKTSICPAVKKAMSIDSIHFSVFDENELTEEQLKSETLKLGNYFSLLPPNDGINDIFKVVGILIAKPSINDIENIVNNVQKELKPHYINQGLLLGKFHSLLKTTSINNPTFIPGKSPYPMLVLRHLVEEDKYFLSSSSADNSTKTKLLESYLKHMDNKISDESISFVKNQIDKLNNNE